MSAIQPTNSSTGEQKTRERNDYDLAYTIVEQMGLGFEFRNCRCGQLPCARLQPIVTALQHREQEVRETCARLMCEHCAAGVELDANTDHVWPQRDEGSHKIRQWEPCDAAPIRRDSAQGSNRSEP
jgi:hypothetical protein